MGYRKARDFVNNLVAKGSSLCSREKMKEIMNMGDVVFKNCNAFISKEYDGNMIIRVCCS